MDTKILRKEEQAGSRGECLKKVEGGGGGETPLQTMDGLILSILFILT